TSREPSFILPSPRRTSSTTGVRRTCLRRHAPAGRAGAQVRPGDGAPGGAGEASSAASGGARSGEGGGARGTGPPTPDEEEVEEEEYQKEEEEDEGDEEESRAVRNLAASERSSGEIEAARVAAALSFRPSRPGRGAAPGAAPRGVRVADGRSPSDAALRGGPLRQRPLIRPARGGCLGAAAAAAAAGVPARRGGGREIAGVLSARRAPLVAVRRGRPVGSPAADELGIPAIVLRRVREVAPPSVGHLFVRVRTVRDVGARAAVRAPPPLPAAARPGLPDDIAADGAAAAGFRARQGVFRSRKAAARRRRPPPHELVQSGLGTGGRLSGAVSALPRTAVVTAAARFGLERPQAQAFQGAQSVRCLRCIWRAGLSPKLYRKWAPRNGRLRAGGLFSTAAGSLVAYRRLGLTTSLDHWSQKSRRAPGRLRLIRERVSVFDGEGRIGPPPHGRQVRVEFPPLRERRRQRAGFPDPGDSRRAVSVAIAADNGVRGKRDQLPPPGLPLRPAVDGAAPVRR
ncbi:MAG: hypothetical protein BJ554DRAFT_4794, partial [Olpidium bornovanus]